MNDEDRAVLARQPMETLAEWWCVLNNWAWPDELPNPELPRQPDGDRRWEIMCWISEAIGQRQISRAWNCNMTDEQFNDFWRGMYEGNKAARARYEHLVTTDAIKCGPGIGQYR